MTAYDSFIGQTFEGRYTIVNVIGIGGMATLESQPSQGGKSGPKRPIRSDKIGMITNLYIDCIAHSLCLISNKLAELVDLLCNRSKSCTPEVYVSEVYATHLCSILNGAGTGSAKHLLIGLNEGLALLKILSVNTSCKEAAKCIRIVVEAKAATVIMALTKPHILVHAVLIKSVAVRLLLCVKHKLAHTLGRKELLRTVSKYACLKEIAAFALSTALLSSALSSSKSEGVNNPAASSDTAGIVILLYECSPVFSTVVKEIVIEPPEGVTVNDSPFISAEGIVLINVSMIAPNNPPIRTAVFSLSLVAPCTSAARGSRSVNLFICDYILKNVFQK